MPICNYENCEMEICEGSKQNKCIFHDPSSNKPGELFKEELVKQLRGEGKNKQFWFKSYYFPSDCCNLVDLVEEATGERAFKVVDFYRAKFEERVNFSEAKFERGADFFGAKFDGGAYFPNAKFEGDADFYGANFEKKAHFSSVKFKGRVLFWDAKFDGRADFSRAKFGKETTFWEAMFEKGTNFRMAEFEGEANFFKTKFKGEANFFGVTFEGLAVFLNSLFNREAVFRAAIFERVCLFDKTVFLDKLSFSNADFKQGIRLTNEQELKEGIKNYAENIDGETIENILSFKGYIKRMEIEVELSKGDQSKRKQSTDSGDKTNTEGRTFKKEDDTKVKLRKLIDLLKKLPLTDRDGNRSWLEVFQDAEEKIPEKVEKGDNNTPEKEVIEDLVEKIGKESKGGLLVEDEVRNITMITPKFGFNDETRWGAKEEGCKVQRMSYEKEGRKTDADKMFAHEMRARRKQKEGRLAQLIEKLIADRTCEYGTNWQRVLKLSGTSIFISTLLYWLANIGLLPGNTYEIAVNGTVLSKLGDSLYYSIITFTTLGYGYLHPNGWLMKTVSASESLAGALFTALIIVVFARKWMRG